MTLRRQGDHYHFEEIAKQTNPADRERFIADAIRTGPGFKFTTELRGPDPARHSVAMLHSAYLAAFRFFGYEYCVHGNSHWIRDLLVRDDPPDDVPVISLDVSAGGWGGTGAGAAPVLFQPMAAKVVGPGDAGPKCLAIALPSPVPDAVRVVLLPGFGPAAMETYDALRKDWAGRDQQVEMATRIIQPERRLADPQFRTYGRWWWQTLCDALDADA
jgi:hypothetical protein